MLIHTQLNTPCYCLCHGGPNTILTQHIIWGRSQSGQPFISQGQSRQCHRSDRLSLSLLCGSSGSNCVSLLFLPPQGEAVYGGGPDGRAEGEFGALCGSHGSQDRHHSVALIGPEPGSMALRGSDWTRTRKHGPQRPEPSNSNGIRMLSFYV